MIIAAAHRILAAAVPGLAVDTESKVESLLTFARWILIELARRPSPKLRLRMSTLLRMGRRPMRTTRAAQREVEKNPPGPAIL